MGKIHDQIIFSLLRFPCNHGVAQSLLPHKVELVFHIPHGLGKAYRLLPLMNQGFRRIHHLVQIPQRLCDKIIGNNRPSHNAQKAADPD